MFRKFRLKYSTWIIVAGLLIGVIVLAIYASYGFSTNRCAEIVVNIKNAKDETFIKKEEIISIVTNNGQEPLIGKHFDKINFGDLEQRILSNKQVRACQVYKDLRGNLTVDIEQYIPIARIMTNNGKEDIYMDVSGVFFPLSKHYTARVPILSGAFFNKLNSLNQTKNQDLLQFITQIKNDEFWLAQFAQLDIDENKNIVIVPLMGKHIIEFGYPEDIDKKLTKLKVFYKQILPVKGWDTFSKVSIKFANQIVCE